MNSLFKKHGPTLIMLACLAVLSIIVGISSKSYFTQPVFYIDQHKYGSDYEDGTTITYRSQDAVPIQVQVEQHKRIVTIGEQNFTITQTASKPIATYNVFYPQGNKYEVEQQHGTLLSYDEKGHMAPPQSDVLNGERIIPEGEEQYTPVMLVTAAFPEYHEKPGMPAFLFLAIAVFIYGWCTFYYESFQRALFWISFQWVWVNNPEPSDFYYVMCKIGGVLCMLLAIWTAFQAF
nr:DUF6199 family natural product biosynthesis protein [Paenibacillus xylanexedens]